jgi:hypothetical protein
MVAGSTWCSAGSPQELSHLHTLYVDSIVAVGRVATDVNVATRSGSRLLYALLIVYYRVVNRVLCCCQHEWQVLLEQLRLFSSVTSLW